MEMGKNGKTTFNYAQERPLDWSETKFRYWYLHHLHHKVKHKWLDA